MEMRELNPQEIEQVNGAIWKEIGQIAGGIAAVAIGTGYTLSTGGAGGVLGGGFLVVGGVSSIGSGFSGLHDEWY